MRSDSHTTPHWMWPVVGLLGIYLASVGYCTDKWLTGEQLRLDDPPIRKYMHKRMPPEPTDPNAPTPRQLKLLQSLLEKGQKGEAERVAWILGDWKGKDNISVLLQAAEHPAASVRRQAARSLGQLHGILSKQQKAQAVRKLRAFLDEPDPRILAASIRSLGKLDAGSLSSTFRNHITSENKDVAVESIRALARTESSDAADELVELLDDSPLRIRVAALRAIRKLGQTSSTGPVIQALDSEHPSVRVTAIRTLGVLGADRISGQIIDQLDDRHSVVRRVALEVLLKLDQDRFDAKFIASTTDEAAPVRAVAARAIGRLGIKDGIDALVQRFADRNRYVRQAAVKSLVQIGTEEAAQRASSALTADIGRARACASETLGRLRSDKRLEEHIELLRDNYLPSRRWASWALGEIGVPAAAPHIFKAAFTEDQNVQVTAAGILSLGKLKYNRVLNKCRRLLPQKPTEKKPGVPTRIRVACARVMGFLDDREGMKLLEARLNDWGGRQPPDVEQVRAASAIALGRIGAERSLKSLKEHMAAAEEQRRVRIACQWAIGKITGSRPELEVPPYPAPSPNYFVKSLQPDTD